MSIRSEIVDGMAVILWGSAWADHAEEHRCTSTSGRHIEDIMPPIPSKAKQTASEIAKKYESLNHMSLEKIYAVALAADGGGVGDVSPERFGGDLAWMAMGAGVSWFDDHEEFPLKEPHFENYELRFYADEKCKDDGLPACKECGQYNGESRTKCENCGKAL